VQQNRWWRALLSAAYAFCLLGFLFCCYPPFQIPLLTLFAPLLAALLYENKAAVRHWRAIAVATGFALIAAGLFAWQLRDTLATISALVYPGERFSTGGGASWTSMLDGFLTLGMTEEHYPKNFDNVVAASSFLNALPLLACVYLARWPRRQRDYVQLVLLVLAGLATLFAVCGIPRLLAQISLWSYATTERLSVALALISVLAVCRFLSSSSESGANGVSRRYAAIGACVFGAVLVTGNQVLHHFVAPASLAAIWAFYSVAGFFLVAKFRLACVAMILFPLAFLNAAINPLNRGLPAYGAISVSPIIAELHRTHPHTRWIVMGTFARSAIISALFKSTGATALSGVIAVPNEEMFDRLDPEHKNRNAYSRYAAVCFLPASESAGAPEFKLEQTTVYSVTLPLTDQWLSAAGIDGVVVFNLPELAVPPPYQEVASVAGYRFWIRSPVE
jgi:hypothetical protein